MDAAIDLAQNVINIKYEDIPADALDLTKKDVLDILGTSFVCLSFKIRYLH